MHFKTYDDTYPDCKSIQSRFSEYLDGILAEEQRRTIHEHLKQCDSCSSELDNLCKTLSILVDYREECLPNSIRNFRLPRSTFIEIFPTIREDKPPRTWGVLVPYVYALIVFFLMMTSWEFAHHTFDQYYNTANWVEVVAKI